MESKHPLGAGKKGLVMLPFGVKQGGSDGYDTTGHNGIGVLHGTR